MKSRLFASTFALVFVAELGDKTQFTAMARSAATGELWPTFAGAAGALVLSTLIAVLCGGALARWVSPRRLCLAAGVLFLCFGVLAVWQGLAAAREVAAAVCTPASAVYGTFALVFLAELGDKTQLTTLACSASGHRWVVFFAASAALVLSTLIAVFFGAGVTRYVDPRWIKLISGALFLLFGALTLREAFRPAPAASGAAAPATGLLAGVAFRMAAVFEAAAVADYEQLAAAATAPRVRDLLHQLAAEERDHLRRVREGELAHASAPLAAGAAVNLPSVEQLAPDVAAGTVPVLAHAAEHERATAAFYETLARAATLPGLQAAFAALAAEEADHARRLESLTEHGGAG